ncbi:hypothetical protein DSC45_02740 [Streptomyces sp. YIM 130001]|nr:hypothetical protein DSC45_02740 [Streptomyces sp. YIM 130001]
MSRARKVTVFALAAGVIGWCWVNRNYFLGHWAMRHSSD